LRHDLGRGGVRIDPRQSGAAPQPQDGADKGGSMSDSYTQAADKILSGLALIREGAPEAMKAFGALSVAATATRALDTKTKELMALAVYMGGGPAAAYAGDAVRAFDEYAPRQ
jgi:hypothetical protein